MNSKVRKLLVFLVVLLSGCTDMDDYMTKQAFSKQDAINKKEKAECIYGGDDRRKVLNNVVYKDEIKVDFEKCMSLPATASSDIEKCASWAHTINGGIWVSENFNSPMTLTTLAQIEQNIADCRDLEKLSNYKVDTL